MNCRRLLVVPALVVAALVAQAGLAAPAQAAGVRYAAPTGSGTACTNAAPCSLATAVTNAASGDEVVVAWGTYSMGTTVLLNPNANVNVHGAGAGAGRPVINTSAITGLQLTGSGARVSDLTINQTGPGLSFGLNLFATGISVQRVSVASTATVACFLGYTGVARDSLCVTSAPNGIAVDDSWGDTALTNGPLTLRNITAVATGTGSYGLRAAAGDFANIDLDTRNVIASGTQADVRASRTATSSDSDVVLQNSNYDLVSSSGSGVTITAAGTGTNQTAAPVYADAAFHQALGSPTIDKGATDAGVGTTDIDGGGRKVGTATDIGADEFVPDTTAPDTAIDHTPKHKTHKRKAVFTFHASETATFTCVVDKKPPAPCSSPYKLKPKKRGRHTLTVIATDTVGNVDATPATFTWKLRKPKRHRHR